MPVLVDVTTTTIFTSPSATSSVSNGSGSTLPIAAIAGGTSAGAVLAIAIVIFWRMWGTNIKRSKAKQQKEADKLRITKQNTMKNASTFSKPRNYSYKPLFWPPSDTKVKFVAPDGSVPATNPTRKTPSRPKPLASHAPRVPTTHKTSTSPAEAALITQPRPAMHSPPTQEPSTSDSEYAPAEERSQSSIFGLVAALGASSPAQRLSTASSWSWFSRSTGNRGGSEVAANRTSLATSGSSYSQPSNRSTTSVGVAY